VNKEITGGLTPVAQGVAVPVLHNGASYPDDLSEDGLIYHFPATNRARRRDEADTGGHGLNLATAGHTGAQSHTSSPGGTAGQRDNGTAGISVRDHKHLSVPDVGGTERCSCRLGFCISVPCPSCPTPLVRVCARALSVRVPGSGESI
jgi:hypothetical protein